MDDHYLGTDLKLQMESGARYPGIGMDLDVSRRGDLSTVKGRENLGQAIVHRLLTRRGELGDLGYPEYGSRLYELIGEPNNERTRELVRLYVKETVLQETRVQSIPEIRIGTVKGSPSLVTVDLSVIPIRSPVPMNIVFPFYLEVE